MARKKIAKRSAKAQSTSKSMMTVQHVEKEMLQVPAKLAAQHSKELSSLKQQESKLKAALQKCKDQVKKADAQMKAAKANTKSAAAKKQLNTAKKNHAQATKAESGLNKELNQISKMIDSISLESTKLNALRKHLGQFSKLWAATVKDLKAKAKAKAKVKASKPKSAKRSAKKVKATTAADSNMTTYDNAIDEAYVTETTEETV